MPRVRGGQAQSQAPAPSQHAPERRAISRGLAAPPRKRSRRALQTQATHARVSRRRLHGASQGTRSHSAAGTYRATQPRTASQLARVATRKGRSGSHRRVAAYAGLRAAAHKQPPRHLPLGGPSLLPGGAPTSETEPPSSTRYARARDHTHPPNCLPTVCGQGNGPDVSPSRHHSRSLHPLAGIRPSTRSRR